MNAMAKKWADGERNIRKRKGGCWEGRYTAGHDLEAGKPIYKNVLGKTQAEVKEKLAEAIERSKGVDMTRARKYTLGQWMEVWFENVAQVKVRPSSHATYRGYLDNHIRPNIGDIPLHKLTTLDLQGFYKKMLDGGRVDKDYVGRVIEALGLEQRLNSLPSQLSGGQQQRVAIARALAAKPAIILADEPTGNLDSKTSQDVLSLMKITSQKFAQTMVMITHNEEIAQTADRIVRIEDGRIVVR